MSQMDVDAAKTASDAAKTTSDSADAASAASKPTSSSDADAATSARYSKTRPKLQPWPWPAMPDGCLPLAASNSKPESINHNLIPHDLIQTLVAKKAAKTMSKNFGDQEEQAEVSDTEWSEEVSATHRALLKRDGRDY